MPEREHHLDLLADHVVRRMHALCGGALREALGRYEVIEAIGLRPDTKGTAESPYGLDQLRYADGLLHDVIGHIQSKWAEGRQSEMIRHPYAPTFDDVGDFD